jgi:hypothetical protein
VTSVSAAYFDAAQRRRDLPALDPELQHRALQAIPEERYQYLERQLVDAFLVPAPFARGRSEGLVGVPILNSDEVQALLSIAEFGEATQEPEQHTWWELWRTESGEYALLPGDSYADLTVAACALVHTNPIVQMRRFFSGYVLGQNGIRRKGSMQIETDTCVREDIDEPGAPYHGRCNNHGCGAGCAADIVVIPQDGLYVLKGCACPP